MSTVQPHKGGNSVALSTDTQLKDIVKQHKAGSWRQGLCDLTHSNMES